MAAREARARSNGWRSSAKFEARFWISNIVIMAFLGLNKQLDIQTLFTEIGRHFAHTGGWYDQRQTIQILFILALSLLAIIAICALFWSLRKMAAAVRVAAIGLCFLCAFVVVRAASFHHVDNFLGEKISGLRWNGILELGGILIITAAAWQYQRKRSYRKR